MPKIEWKINIGNPSDYQKGALQKNAHKLEMPKTMNEMQKRALPFVIPAIFIIFISMFFKTKNAGHIVVSPITIIIGIVVSATLLVVHEFLHAIVYPSKARVVIGFVPKEFMAVALTSYPLRRSRFIVMCLLPYLLGIIPIILFCISPATNIEINGFLFGLSFLGLTSPCVDSYNVFQALRQTKEGDYLQFYGDDLYAFSDNL